jgi:hypothetical protein
MYDLIDALNNGSIVVVDITIDSSSLQLTSSGGAAHFARVVGINLFDQTIKLQNTLGANPAVITVSLSEFYQAWTNPELDAADDKQAPDAEEVNNWAMIISR